MFHSKDEIERKKILMDWIRLGKGKAVQFQEKKLQQCLQEPWDAPFSRSDQSWGPLEEINSFLHIITKFLKILAFDYQVVSVGKMDLSLKKALDAHKLPIVSKRSIGNRSQLEFWVIDRLGQKWMISFLQVDQKSKIVEMTVCLSLERCIALMADRWEGRIEG